MTSTTKPVKRETLSLFRDKRGMRNIVIELNTTYAVLRLKGCRYKYTVSYDQLWRLGAQNAAAARRQEKIEAKAAKKKQAVRR